MITKEKMDMLSELNNENGVSTKKLLELGFKAHDLTKLVKNNQLQRIKRGLYIVNTNDMQENHNEISPKEIIKLLKSKKVEGITLLRQFLRKAKRTNLEEFLVLLIKIHFIEQKDSWEEIDSILQNIKTFTINFTKYIEKLKIALKQQQKKVASLYLEILKRYGGNIKDVEQISKVFLIHHQVLKDGIVLIEPKTKKEEQLLKEIIMTYSNELMVIPLNKENKRTLLIKEKPLKLVANSPFKGESFYKKGMYEKALKEYRDALPGIKSKKFIYYRLGCIYEKLGQNSLAQKYFQVVDAYTKKIVSKEEKFIHLVQNGMSLETATKEANLNQEERNKMYLLYIKECFILGKERTGEFYLKQIMKEKEKSNEIKEMLIKIQQQKRFFPNQKEMYQPLFLSRN